MNTKLLLKVKSRILAHPEHFNMSNWQARYTIPETSECKTTACIAGWTLLILRKTTPQKGCADYIGLRVYKTSSDKRPKTAKLFPEEKVRQALDIDGTQYKKLCYIYQWPMELFQRYTHTSDQIEKSLIAAERIDRFIATNGQE